MGEGNSCVGQARLDIAAIVNQHTQNLSDYQARKLPWNIEQPQIVIEARDGMAELNKVIKKCPEAREDVWPGIGRLMTNAESAYKETLFPHETFDKEVFLEETQPSEDNFENDKDDRDHILATRRAASLFLGSLLAHDVPKSTSILGRVFLSRALSLFTLVGSVASIAYDLYNTGSFIYMKATNPDLQFMTVEE